MRGPGLLGVFAHFSEEGAKTMTTPLERNMKAMADFFAAAAKVGIEEIKVEFHKDSDKSGWELDMDIDDIAVLPAALSTTQAWAAFRKEHKALLNDYVEKEMSGIPNTNDTEPNEYVFDIAHRTIRETVNVWVEREYKSEINIDNKADCEKSEWMGEDNG
jgi:hypothetical protein